MTILAKAFRPVKPALPINRPTTTTLESRSVRDFVVSLTTTEAWWAQADEDERFRFHVRAIRGGALVESKGFDLEADARFYALVLGEMLASPAEEMEPYTADDAAWWAEHSPTSQSLFYVEGAVDPSDTHSNTLAAADYHREPMAVCLSDDHNGAFIGEGGDR